MFDLTTIFKSEATFSNPLTIEYRLMYYFGGWVTKSMIYAESDAEAIYDARNEVMQSKAAKANKMPYALFKGNRLVKRFNYTGAAYNPEYTTIK